VDLLETFFEDSIDSMERDEGYCAVWCYAVLCYAVAYAVWTFFEDSIDTMERFEGYGGGERGGEGRGKQHQHHAER
jgi:hypothetical protein